MGPDTRRIAQLEGLTLSGARARYDWQADFGAVANRLEATYPDLYAGERVDDDSMGAEITFVGAVPAEAEALVKSVTAPVRLRLSSGTIPLAQLETELRSAHRRIYSDSEVANVVGSLDVGDASIQFRVQPKKALKDLSPLAQEDLLNRLRKMAPSRPGISTHFSLTDHAGGFH